MRTHATCPSGVLRQRLWDDEHRLGESLDAPLRATLHRLAHLVRRCTLSADSNAPAPGTSASSTRAFFTARRPSRTASLSCAMV